MGAAVVQATTPEPAVIVKMRKIVAEGQYTTIDGMMVDLFTASAVINVFDALTEQNQRKFTALSLRKMVGVTWKLMK